MGGWGGGGGGELLLYILANYELSQTLLKINLDLRTKPTLSDCILIHACDYLSP